MKCAVQKNSLFLQVLELLGPNLGELLDWVGGKFTLATVVKIGSQVVSDLIIIAFFNKGGSVVCMSRISHDILYSYHFNGKPNYSRLSIGSEACMKLGLCIGSCRSQIYLRFCSKY